MDIIIKSEGEETIIRIEDKDVDKLTDAIYWFLKDNHINPIIITKQL